MTWTKRINEDSYDYKNPEGNVLANVHMVGIKGRWRWAGVYARFEKGWSGFQPTKEAAQAKAEEYLREKGLV